MITVLGAFDGFHRGHVKLLERAKIMANSLGKDWGVVTFEPHPGLFLGAVESTLFTRREMEIISARLGVPRAVLLTFDKSLSEMPPKAFWDFLRSQTSIDGVVVGSDFRFGFERAGDAALLGSFCYGDSIPFECVDLVLSDGSKVSSSAIRSCVSGGECEKAAEKLGYPWFIEGDIMHGVARGRTLGFPTANLNVTHRKLLPPDGVYATSATIDVGGSAESRPAALSIGVNPTFDDSTGKTVEAFILDYDGDLYGETITISFLSRLRPQVKFSDSSALVQQIKSDVERTREIFLTSKASLSRLDA
ncbi:riboflavin biosynthesis protein [Synergistales bacterium]|nr:riboflavin biosynthesis protein [Synergistales bacterium]